MLRPADENDMEFAFSMMLTAGGGFVEKALGVGSSELAKKIFLTLWTGKPNRFHCHNAHIAETNGIKTGFISSYSTDDKYYSGIPTGRILTAGGLRLVSYYLLRPGFVLKLIRLPEGKSGELYIGAAAVIEGFRGKGIGTLLMEKAFDKAKGYGLKTVSLTVSRDNHEAVRFYRSLGFCSDDSVGRKQPVYRMSVSL